MFVGLPDHRLGQEELPLAGSGQQDVLQRRTPGGSLQVLRL